MKIQNLSGFLLTIVIALFLLLSVGTATGDSPQQGWLIGPQFYQELERPFALNSNHSELRQVLSQISSDRRVSIFLDRRIDPTADYAPQISNVTLRTGLLQVANLGNGEIAIVGNTVYLGPKTTTSKLRTLIELRNLEYAARSERRVSQIKRRTIEWDDLESPREIMELISREFRQRISNREIVPHDLWAATRLPEVSFVEAISMILIQYELTFRWSQTKESIELIPIPAQVVLERKHRPKQKLADTIATIHRHFPDLDAQIVNSDILVRGLLEDHEAVATLLRGDGPKRAPKSELPQDLRRQLFTFKTELPVPLSAVMKNLEESEIRFEFDADELKAAGVDFEQLIQIDVKNRSAEEFFQAVFGPARLECQVGSSTVKLRPKRDKQTK